MKKYKIGKYIVKADSIHDAVTIVKTIKNSIKDKRVFGFGNFPYEYWLKNNDGGWFLAAFSKRKYDRSEIEALRNKYKLKNGKLPDYQEKIVDSVKDSTGSDIVKKIKGAKDSVTVREVIESLVTEETSAIASYNVALETLRDHIPAEAYEAIKAIRDDEQRHVENLYAVLNGNVTPKNLEN